MNESKWRQRLIPLLTIPHFDPEVFDWSVSDVSIERDAKAVAGALLYVITPRQVGRYTVAELMTAVYRENTRPVVLAFLEEPDMEFQEHEKKSDKAVCELIQAAGANATILSSLKEIADYLNQHEAFA